LPACADSHGEIRGGDRLIPVRFRNVFPCPRRLKMRMIFNLILSNKIKYLP
jgi:hypothetical protein